MRSLFGERVLTNSILKSTAVSDAGLTKQTLYEVGRENFTRVTYDRAIESLDNVNGEIEGLIREAWGGLMMKRRDALKEMLLQLPSDQCLILMFQESRETGALKSMAFLCKTCLTRQKRLTRYESG